VSVTTLLRDYRPVSPPILAGCRRVSRTFVFQDETRRNSATAAPEERPIRLGSLFPLKAVHGGVRITGDKTVVRPADDHPLVSFFDNSEAPPGMPNARPDCAAAVTAGEDLPWATAGRLAPSYLPPSPFRLHPLTFRGS
jgi:hypothetical protein